MNGRSLENLELFDREGGDAEGSDNDAQPESLLSVQDGDETPEVVGGNSTVQSRARRKPMQRHFPAAPFEETLEIPMAIQQYASGQRIRRMTLFDKLDRSPESGTSRQLITNSGRYSLTTGSYKAEWLELTELGRIATADDVPEREKIRARFKLAIELIEPFKILYEQYINKAL